VALLIAPFADAIGPASMFANHVTSNFMLAKAAPAPPAPKQTGLGTRMVLGALGGMGASSVCHPLDVVRVQMQVSGGAGGAAAYKNPLDAAVQIVKRKGFFGGLYTGIDAAYLRQWTYGSCRVGIYAFLLDKFQKGNKDPKTGKNQPVPFSQKLLMGSVAGAIGSFAGLPSEVSLVRMSADSKMAPELQRNYKSCMDCLVRTAKEEGVTKLWSGGVPTIIRATLLSASVLGCYSEAKERLHKEFPQVFPNKDGVPLMFTATMFASFVATTVSNPFDVVKSRVQNMPKALPGQEQMYKGMLDCFAKSVKGEGPMVLYRGFTPAFLKLAPYTTISLILTEQLSKQLLGKSAL
jgi:solute carrier family 25 oxoglutarate transporter 11